MTEKIINKVAQSGIITLDLAKYIPPLEQVELDISQFLFRQLILREKDFREQLKTFDWEQLNGKAVAVHCSTDAIVPHWAFMLITTYLQPHAKVVVYGTKAVLGPVIAAKALEALNPSEFVDQRVVVKGCGEAHVDAAAYLEVTKLLQPVVKSLMYGEPCSTVPIYKNRK